MSAQFTNSIQLLVSNTASDLTSSSKSYNNFEDTDAFSAALDNATKSYADKSENKTNVQKQDYAKDTKDVQNSSKSDNTNKTDTNDNKQEIKDSEKSQTEEKQTTAVDETNSQQTESATKPKETETSQTDTTPQTDTTQANTTQQNAAVLLLENPVQNVITNEQILSNIEQVQTSAETQSIQTKSIQTQATQNSAVVGTDAVTAATADIEIDTKTLQAVQDIAQEATQETVDEKSNLIKNVQQTADPDAVALTPADTEADNAPVIKVTQEVAANTKENSLANAMENKDTTSTIKDKVVAQMTQLEDTNTVVTQSSTTDSSSQQQNGTLNGNNAQEQIMKMSVEANSDVSTGTLTGTETFAGKLDSQLSAATKTSSSVLQNQLNQNSILEQVNKQFEQLQQTGNNKVSIVLQPENLGRVSVEIMNSKDGITAKMLTDNQQVKDLFDKNIEALKSNLSSQGVNVNNIKVECTQESANNAMNFERDQFNQSFDSQNNSSHHNQTNQSNAQSSYTADSSGFEEGEIEMNGGVEIKNTQTMIQHNGKVDYEV